MIQAKRISPQFMLDNINKPCVPIHNGKLDIPNIVVPNNLTKKSAIDKDHPSIVNIRMTFNNVTNENVNAVTDRFRTDVKNTIRQSPEMIENIADEIYRCMIVMNKNIGNGMKLINSVRKICTIGKDDKPTPTIGTIFIDICRKDFITAINPVNVGELCKLNDEENIDDFDQYNLKKTKLLNTVTIICMLFMNRNNDLMRLGNGPIYTVVNCIMSYYTLTLGKIDELGDPYSEEGCSDEEKYELYRKMATLYTEILYQIMKYIGKEMNNCGEEYNGNTLSSVVEKFRHEIVPTIYESYLVHKCKRIDY